MIAHLQTCIRGDQTCHIVFGQAKFLQITELIQHSKSEHYLIRVIFLHCSLSVPATGPRYLLASKVSLVRVGLCADTPVDGVMVFGLYVAPEIRLFFPSINSQALLSNRIDVANAISTLLSSVI